MPVRSLPLACLMLTLAKLYPSHMVFSVSEVRLSCPRARRDDE
jgi:hypothetical protein